MQVRPAPYHNEVIFRYVNILLGIIEGEDFFPFSLYEYVYIVI